MKTHAIAKLTLSWFFLFIVSSVCFAVPAQINFQGMLEDAQGPVTGNVTMTFRLFDVEINGNDPLWEENQSVDVYEGIYTVILGNGTINELYGELAQAILSNDDLWLEVQVSDDVLVPRQKITSVGFAVRAGTVSDGAITVAKLAPNAVTTDKLADGAVTAIKVSGGPGSGLNADQLDGKSAEDFGAAADLTQARADIAALQAEVQALKELLAGVTRTGSNIYFDGVNVHVRSGSGATYDTVNGLGNLIVGYNETRGVGDDRSGSHNIVVGRKNNFSSYGGIVAGYYNSVSAPNASVTGGYYNTASEYGASVSGGYSNTASGDYASVSGGSFNTASGSIASVSGGNSNTASGTIASVSGGNSNTASGNYASVSGGAENTASAKGASVSGGENGIADWAYSECGADHNCNTDGEHDFEAQGVE